MHTSVTDAYHTIVSQCIDHGHGHVLPNHHPCRALLPRCGESDCKAWFQLVVQEMKAYKYRVGTLAQAAAPVRTDMCGLDSYSMLSHALRQPTATL